MNAAEKINSEVDIKTVISDLTGERPSQSDKVRCPFHDDTEPSLHIYDETNTWYCFGCNRGHTVIDFVMEYNDLDFQEGLRWLSDEYVISIDGMDEEDLDAYRRKKREREEVYEVLDRFTKLCEERLDEAKIDDKTIKQYIKDKRSFTDETVDNHRIGYCDEDVIESLRNEFSESRLQQAGILVKRKNIEDSLTPHYNDRIVYPYLQFGHTVYTIGQKTKNTPEWSKAKYKKHPVNKDEVSDVVENVVYGLDRQLRSPVLIAEGITDCISLRQLGFSSISAVTTRFKEQDLDDVESYLKDKEVYLVPDNEESQEGMNGAVDTLKHLITNGIDAKLVELPRDDEEEKVDVDDFTSESDTPREDMKELMDEAICIGGAVLKFDEGGKKKLVRKALEIAARSKDELINEEVIDDLTSTTGYNKGTLRDELERIEQKVEQEEQRKIEDEEDEEDQNNSEDKDLEKVYAEPTLEEIDILSSPNLLSNINDAMHRLGGMKRLIGENRNVLRIFLNSISAFTTEEPINTFIKGRTSEGKSTMAKAVHSLIPEDKKKVLAGASGTAWRRMNTEEKEDEDGNIQRIVDWSDKSIFLLEGDEARDMLEAMKPILSHDKKELSYPVTEEIDGEMEVVDYVIKGFPSVTILATEDFLSSASATRYDNIEPEVGEWKTKKVNQEKANYKKSPWLYKGEEDEELLSSALRHLEEFEVCIPLLDDIDISEYLPHSRGAHNRLADRFFSMVDTITLIHQYQRPRLKVDEEEYLIATKSDLLIAAWLMGDELIGIDDDTQRFLDKVLRPIWESKDKDPIYDTLENKAKDEDVPHSRNSVKKYLNRLEKRGIVKVVEKSSEKGRKYFYPINNVSEDNEDASQPINHSHSDLIGRIRDASIALDDVISTIESGVCQSVEDIDEEKEEEGSPIFTLPDIEIEDEEIVDDNPLFRTISEEEDSFHKGVVCFINLIGGEVEELLDTLKSPYQTDMTGTDRLTSSTCSQDEEPIKEQILRVLSEADRDLDKNEIFQKVNGYDRDEVEAELHRLKDEENCGVTSPSVDDSKWRMR